MKTTPHHQSATSLPRAPRDSVESRSLRYLIMMGVRVVCFALMVFIQPFGWYTWVFGAVAIFLPYIAVVLANVGEDSKTVTAVPPEKTLEGPRPPEPRNPTVIRVAETPAEPTGDEKPKSSPQDRA